MTSITLRQVSVDMPVGNVSNRSLRNNIISAATGGQIKGQGTARRIVRALDNIDLKLEHGSRIGLIGHNGAGKSTLLRVMAGIYEPTAGSVRVEGVVSPMLDIRFGLELDSTGWENIMLRGMLIGMSQKDVTQRMDEIGSASDLGDFLNMPLRTYSAGMIARLAFAVSTSRKSEILLIDEGIGAGDAAFLARARDRMTEFIGGAGILVLATHSDSLIREWCDTGVWLEHGRIKMQGPADQVIKAYRG